MTDKKKPIVQEVEVPPIEPIDPMQQILQGMLAMQAKTNDTLEKLSEKMDTLAAAPAESAPKNEEDMIREMGSKRLREVKMYKVLVIKNIIPLSPEDQQLHGDMFGNGGVERKDTNKRFDNEKEAKEYGEKMSPGKFKLLPVTVPVSEGAEFKKRNINIQA